jgi:hypothetical protein
MTETSYIFAEQNLVASNVSSVTHTENGFAITETQDINNIFIRSLVKNYQFNFTESIATKILTINLTSPIHAEGVAVMGMKQGGEIQTIKLYNGASLLSNCTELVTQDRVVGRTPVKDFAWTVDDDVASFVNKIVITWVNEDTGSGHISAVFVANSVYNFGVHPQIDYSFHPIATGQKQRTIGGQVYGTHFGAYRKARFNTKPMSSAIFNDSLQYINYDVGEVGQVLFVPRTADNFFMYGSQAKCFSVRNLADAQAADGKWKQIGTFEIEEEF